MLKECDQVIWKKGKKKLHKIIRKPRQNEQLLFLSVYYVFLSGPLCIFDHHLNAHNMPMCWVLLPLQTKANEDQGR